MPLKKPLKPVHFLEKVTYCYKSKDSLKWFGLPAEKRFHPATRFRPFFKALKVYQKRMGLSVDGAIGPKLIEEINVTPAGRVKQILVNLERMRWMPVEEASKQTHFVNIPDYKMYVYDSGKISFSMNVIVGTTANNTVIFSGDLKYIVFSPYWKVPVKSLEQRSFPGIKRPQLSCKARYGKIGGSDTLPSIRQKPGPSNSLGKVKFLFPTTTIYTFTTRLTVSCSALRAAVSAMDV